MLDNEPLSLLAALTDLAKAKNSLRYLSISLGLASTRRTLRRAWRSTSPTHSSIQGSLTAITTS
ncbi:hypothetical protein D3C81_2082510 [compost metagenome]